MITVRPATRADFVAFYDAPPPMTMRALCAASSTGMVIFGGYYIDAQMAVVFSDTRPAWHDKPKRQRLEVMGEFVSFCEASSLELIASPASTDGDVAMRHFGFAPVDPDNPASPYRREV